jgi:DNA-binding NarL/FixJ family response regulator
VADHDSPALTVLIVDDHFVVRSGLVTLLEGHDDIRIVAEAECGEDALSAYLKYQPTVVLLDLQLPGGGGVATAAALVANDSNARILIFSNYSREDEIQSALNVGALGYISKSAGPAELLTALRAVASCKRYLTEELARRLNITRLGPVITTREREILSHIAAGHANKQIATMLNISEFTVKRHVSHILDKMGVNDRAQAAVEAIRRGLVRMPD